MDDGGIDRIRAGDEPRDGRVGHGDVASGELVGRGAEAKLDRSGGRQFGERLGQEHQALARERQPSEQRLVEDEDHGQAGMGGGPFRNAGQHIQPGGIGRMRRGGGGDAGVVAIHLSQRVEPGEALVHRPVIGGGEIRQRHRVARKPAAMVQQPRHVIEVIFDRLGPGLHVLAVRVAMPQKPLN